MAKKPARRRSKSHKTERLASKPTARKSRSRSHRSDRADVGTAHALAAPARGSTPTSTRADVFFDGLQISPESIAALGDRDLNLLVRELFVAEAQAAGVPPDRMIVNTDENASDGGSDASTPKPERPSRWFGDTPTCWQFKAGRSGEPAKLRGEVTKRLPREALEAGGRFVVIAPGAVSGQQGIDDRKAVLVREARLRKIPTDRIEVFGSELLAQWCNEHPAVSMRWASAPSGLCTLSQFANMESHRAPWHPPPNDESRIEVARADLDFDHGNGIHLHIQGPPGVGKSRLALELCRGAPWSAAVLYVRDAAAISIEQIIAGVAASGRTRLVLVVDEVDGSRLLPLRDSIERANGRLRLITIGHSKTPDPRRIPALEVKPLSEEIVENVVREWFGSMPREHVSFVARFAAGYVRLARLAADAVNANPALDVHGLLSIDHIQTWLGKMLSLDDRRPLYVVAVLTHVRWEGDAPDGQVIARHLGLRDWEGVRVVVDRFQRGLQVVQQGGAYRYISPAPLAILLAKEAWEALPDKLRTLPALLSEEGRQAYYDRLQSLASTPQAREFAKEELERFFRLIDFAESSKARNWAALAVASPARAAELLRIALEGAPVAERLNVEGDARRALVHTLDRLAWSTASFRDALLALAYLAEAENEKWANNATGQFLEKFQVRLGGTAASFADRLAVLDDLLEIGSPSLDTLVVRALARACDPSPARMGIEPPTVSAPESEWSPKTHGELWECVRESIDRLTSLVSADRADLEPPLVEAATSLVRWLFNRTTRPSLADFFARLRREYPGRRELLRRAVASEVQRARSSDGFAPEPEVRAVESLHETLRDTSPSGLLHEAVGVVSWDLPAPPDLRSFASRLIEDRSALGMEWGWLTSGEAADAYRLGETLASLDVQQSLDRELTRIPNRGPDSRVIFGFVDARTRTYGSGWFDRWLTDEMRARPHDWELLFELSWRIGIFPETVGLVDAALRGGSVPRRLVGRLQYGRWVKETDRTTLGTVVKSLFESGNADTALQLLAHRLKGAPEEWDSWLETSLALVCVPELLRGNQTIAYYWAGIAKRLCAPHPGVIARTIFSAHGHREAGFIWFLEHSSAVDVLSACVDASPTAVWAALRPYLTRKTAYRYVVGLPVGVIDRMPRALVMKWLRADRKRAPVTARLVRLDLADDSSLAAQVLQEFGNDPEVASAFFAAFISGGWSGSSAEHWRQLASRAAGSVASSSMPRVRSWLRKAAADLNRMADRDAVREAEEHVRRGWQ